MTSSTSFCPSGELQQRSALRDEHDIRLTDHCTRAVLELLALKPGEVLLDIGCGDGHLSEQLQRYGNQVVGFDSDPSLVSAARARGLEARHGNAEQLYFYQEFDAVLSYDALHWMQRSDQVAVGIYEALKPGGRFVGEFAGAEHQTVLRRALRDSLARRSLDFEVADQLYLPTAGAYQQVLENAGFHVSAIHWFEHPVTLDCSIAQWLQMFGSRYLALLPSESQEAFLNEVSEELTADLLDSNGQWTLDCTRLRFKAEKK
ncbi:methyltransferase domain-containing protein [Pseudomonas gingeri]|uniref:class I SAM-dependent methyltransferase n=1 Tax=Pseudomonas gingeri TaxID=117681 RepID=UPI0015A48D3B|nr:methyltransferase domain-containing protein [Pseudomonas gingeri]NWD66404.1 methyltransferase domain-containing protein [Pseudomonas gingeri]